MIKDVLKEPNRDERLVEKGIDPDHAIFFLYRSKNEILFWPSLLTSAPHYSIAAQTISKIPLVQSIEYGAQIKVSSFMLEGELPLHWKLRMGDLSFRFLCHMRSLHEGRPTFYIFY